MGFNRVLISGDSKMPHPMRAGDGLVANCLNQIVTATATLTMSQLASGHIIQTTTLGAAATYTLPTAVDILAAFAEMDIGDSYSFMVTNGQAAAFAVVLAVGAGITAQGANNSLSVAPNSSRMFSLVKASATTMDLY